MRCLQSCIAVSCDGGGVRRHLPSYIGVNSEVVRLLVGV